MSKLSISNFCKKAWISRVTFYLHYEKIKHLLQCEVKKSFKAISGEDILRVREYLTKKWTKIQVQHKEIKKEYYFKVSDALDLIGMSAVTFSKKMFDKEFVDLFHTSKAIEKVKTIDESWINEFKKYLNKHSKMLYFEEIEEETNN